MVEEIIRSLRRKPNYSSEKRKEITYTRLDKIPEDYKDKKILIIGDSQKIESSYLKQKGFLRITSCEYDYPEEEQKRFNIEKDILSEKFDLIYLSHVLEHCLSPFKALLHIREMLKDDGKIFVFLPEEAFCWQKLYHLYCFNFDQWQIFLKRTWLKIISAEVTPLTDRYEYLFILQKVKIGAIVRCYHLTQFLEKVLKNLAWVDKIILANFRYKGVEPAFDDTEQIYKKINLPNIIFKKGEDLEQYEVFNLCMKDLKGYDYVFINDADEILLRNDQLKILNDLMDTKKDIALCKVLDYAKDFYHIYPIRTHMPIVVANSNCVWREGEKRTPNYGEGLKVEKSYLHHFGYIVNDLDWKIKNAWHTNKNEIQEMMGQETLKFSPPRELLDIMEGK